MPRLSGRAPGSNLMLIDSAWKGIRKNDTEWHKENAKVVFDFQKTSQVWFSFVFFLPRPSKCLVTLAVGVICEFGKEINSHLSCALLL